LISRQNDVAMRAYAVLLEQNKSISARDIAMLIDEPLTVVRRALEDLHILNIIDRERTVKGPITFDYWRVMKPVLGLLRLIPSEYFKEGYPNNLIKKEED